MLSVLPEAPAGSLSREFLGRAAYGEVTSVEVVSHGAYLFCGLSDGQILLFDMLGRDT